MVIKAERALSPMHLKNDILLDAPKDHTDQARILKITDDGSTTGDDSLVGTALDDHISADNGNDSVLGLEGGDILRGNAGRDTLRGGNGNDTLYGGDDLDTIEGGADNDVIYDSGKGTRILAGSGDDLITYTGYDYDIWRALDCDLFGGIGNDRLSSSSDREANLYGGAGNDLLIGSPEVVEMYGGHGDDRYVLTPYEFLSGVVVNESRNGGYDTVSSSEGVINAGDFRWIEKLQLIGNRNGSVTGSGSAELVLGAKGNDTIESWDGRDTLRGGEGNDWLDGEDGRDFLAGGAGRDSFVLRLEVSDLRDRVVSVITDFQHGVDRFVVKGMNWLDVNFIGAQHFSGVSGEIRYDRETGRLGFDYDGDGTADWFVLLSNKTTLSDSDFVQVF
jgi:Ca2+-binding RTX toxin-like protein